jgi:hypothetical protein
LVESLHCDAVAGEHDIERVIAPPPDGVTSYRHSVELALDHIGRGQFEPTWDSSASTGPAGPLPSDPDWSGQVMYSDSVTRTLSAGPDRVWNAVESAAHAGNSRWHVQSSDPKRAVRLKDRGRLPGSAWLDIRVSPHAGGGSEVDQRAVLCPRGIAGRMYAVTVWPVRRVLLRRRVSRLTT